MDLFSESFVLFTYVAWHSILVLKAYPEPVVRGEQSIRLPPLSPPLPATKHLPSVVPNLPVNMLSLSVIYYV